MFNSFKKFVLDMITIGVFIIFTCIACDCKMPAVENPTNPRKDQPNNLTPITEEMIKIAQDDAAKHPHSRTPFLVEVLRKLKDNEPVNINAIDPYNVPGSSESTGQTALYQAVEVGDVAIVKALLERKADANQPSKLKYTPLHEAAGISGKPNSDIVRILLQQPGININPRGFSDQTPLHVAAEEGAADIVEQLVNKPGIELEPVDETGRTPLQVANAYIQTLLRSKGATK